MTIANAGIQKEFSDAKGSRHEVPESLLARVSPKRPDFGKDAAEEAGNSPSTLLQIDLTV